MWRKLKLKRWLYLIHRWMGIAGCLLIAMWFGSGLVMMYVGFPALTDAERLAGLPPLALRSIATTPDAAMAAAELDTFPRSLRLEMAGDLPVYRMIDGRGRLLVLDTHGRQGVNRLLMGSVAEKLARSALTPVLLVRMRADA